MKWILIVIMCICVIVFLISILTLAGVVFDCNGKVKCGKI
jgi:hypothetical protein